MGNYYFLLSALPPVHLDLPAPLSFSECRALLESLLSPHDLDKVGVLQRYFDLDNIRLLSQEVEIDPRGNLTEKELDDALLNGEDLPQYALDFIAKYQSAKERIDAFELLLYDYFSLEAPEEEGFLKKYFAFERESRLVLMALRAGKNIEKIQKSNLFSLFLKEDNAGSIVDAIVQTKEGELFAPPAEYAQLGALYQREKDSPWSLYRAILKYSFEKIEHMHEGTLFSIDAILAYLARLFLVEEIQGLDQEGAFELFETTVNMTKG